MRRRITGGLVLLALAGCGQRIMPPGPPAPRPGSGEVEASLLLIGDAGRPDPAGEPVLRALHGLLPAAPDSTVVLFLGDNLYPRGLPDSTASNRRRAERRLAAQIDAALVGSVRSIFVPGNHDWEKSGAGGWDAIRRQADFIGRYSAGRAVMLPQGGCPGPAVAVLGGRIRLILLDTEWWLHGGPKPAQGSECGDDTETEVETAVTRLLADSSSLVTIVAGHHPLATGGQHGGYFPWDDHLFPLRKLHSALWIPLPVIGSLYPAARAAGISSEDLAGGRNVRMRAALERAFGCHPPALYAAGHEHGLQLIDRRRPPLLAVSGAGIYGHTAIVTAIPGTRLALSEAGFMRVDVLRDGRLRLAVVTVDRDGRAHEVHAEWLARPAKSECGGEVR